MAETELPSLTVDNFSDYFAALWDGRQPFGWQRDLLDRLVKTRHWPAQIDLPTGTGKTSVIDIAVFVLALGAEIDPADRWHPLRIVLVVDRRVIVDQADERASHIADALDQAQDGVLFAVAQRLRALAPGVNGELPETPISHTVLRGGIIRDETWAQRPDVPAIISSTVDQVGSRLLFRGYGISCGMRPIHAGLLANDVLYLLDEVHLAEPFADTLKQLDWYRKAAEGGQLLPDRWQVVQMSATLSDDSEAERFPDVPLTQDDNPTLSRRLSARKPARLVSVTTGANPLTAQEKLVKTYVAEASTLRAEGARTIGVIVNRVNVAQRVVAELEEMQSKLEEPMKVALITGRMRPVDRDHALDCIRPFVTLGRARNDSGQPLILVSTQSIEAGADFDLDAIVTECASLDALRQRFGRVDRDGQLSAAGSAYTSVIVAGTASVLPTAFDPVYGAALRETWDWLTAQDGLDFGINYLRVPNNFDDLKPLLPLRECAPVLLPTHLDRWVQTTNYGVSADPDVAHWLHGIDASAQAEDVSVVWRNDLQQELVAKIGVDKTNEGDVTQEARGVLDRVEACPPQAREALAIPLTSVQAWLGTPRVDETPPGTADVPLLPQEPPARRPPPNRRVITWRDAKAELILIGDIVPGDTIVVPAELGGICRRCWDPTATEPVPDCYKDAAGPGAPRRISRAECARPRDTEAASTDESTLSDLVEFPDPDELDELPVGERRELVNEFLRQSGKEELPPRTSLLAFPEGIGSSGEVLRSYIAVPERARRVLDDEDGQDGTSFTATKTTLAEHLSSVGTWAARLAENLGFPSEVGRELCRAGQLHDLGKLDPRFQQWLLLGDAWRLVAETEPLAKSIRNLDPASKRQAQFRSGYTPGLRHELLSVELVPTEPELVLYLIGSHHGRGRYRFDPQPPVKSRPVDFSLKDVEVHGSTDYRLDRLGEGVPERFWSQNRHWGWFGLAWLEAVLRLADHEDSRSRDAQRGDD